MADDASSLADLYERDFYAWSKAQARALKGREAGSNALDYDRLAEEVGDLGKSERNAVRSSLRNIIVHLLLVQASRSETVKRHWAVEVLNFREEVEAHMTPSLRRLARNDLEMLHRRAAAFAERKLELEQTDAEVDANIRWSLAELLGERDDPLAALLPHFRSRRGS